MKYLICIFFICTLSVHTFAQVEMVTQCPPKNPMQDFNLTKFVGNWVEMKRYDHRDGLRECVRVSFTEVENGKLLINETFKMLPKPDLISEGDTAVLKNPTSGRLSLQSHGNNSEEYLILATDYVNYAVLWSCENIGGANRSIQSIWILSRGKPFPSDVDAKLNALVSDVGIKLALFKNTEQTEAKCGKLPYTPSPTKSGSAAFTSSSMIVMAMFAIFQIFK